MNLTWNPPKGAPPDLTPCMENVILVWGPCGLLWLLLLPYIYTLNGNLRGRTPQPLTGFTLFKSVSIVSQYILVFYCNIEINLPKLIGL